MTRTTAQTEDSRVTAYALGELTGEERVAFEAELEGDEALRNEVARVRELAGSLAEAYANEGARAWPGKHAPAMSTAQYVIAIGVILVLVGVLGQGMKKNLGSTAENVLQSVNAKLKQLMQAGLQ